MNDRTVEEVPLQSPLGSKRESIVDHRVTGLWLESHAGAAALRHKVYVCVLGSRTHDCTGSQRVQCSNTKIRQLTPMCYMFRYVCSANGRLSFWSVRARPINRTFRTGEDIPNDLYYKFDKERFRSLLVEVQRAIEQILPVQINCSNRLF